MTSFACGMPAELLPRRRISGSAPAPSPPANCSAWSSAPAGRARTPSAWPKPCSSNPAACTACATCPTANCDRRHRAGKAAPDPPRLRTRPPLHQAARNIRPQIRSPADAANLVLVEMSALEHEELRVLLDTKLFVKRTVTVYQGNLNTAVVRVGEVFTDHPRPGILIVVLHNHPPATLRLGPVRVTEQMVEAGKLLDIDVVDHLVIAGHRYVSLKSAASASDPSDSIPKQEHQKEIAMSEPSTRCSSRCPADEEAADPGCHASV